MGNQYPLRVINWGINTALPLLFLLAPGLVFADMLSPSHGCIKPFKPFEFSSRDEYDDFMDDVSRYRRCIEDFVEEQKEEAQSHTEAADEAIEEWNSFVRFELN